MASEILEQATANKRIGFSEAVALFSEHLIDLGLAADRICRQKHREPFRTYVIDRNINYSNICVSRCRFCAFWREPDSPQAYLITEDEVLEKVAQAKQLGATQILMQGGLHPQLPLAWYENLLRTIKSQFEIHLHCFSSPEVVNIARVSGLSIEQVLARLKEAGLDSLPGGGAEILCDSVRSRVSPTKCTTDQWFQVMAAAHHLGLPTTATMMFGHIETIDQRVEHLLRVREAQDRTGGFTAFIPWTYQPRTTALGGKEVGAHDYLRTLAISRLVLDNFDNIQASWVTQGPKIGQVALKFGANDLGSTMMEENVVRAAGANFQMSELDLIALIEDAGFETAQRDTLYHILQRR